MTMHPTTPNPPPLDSALLALHNSLTEALGGPVSSGESTAPYWNPDARDYHDFAESHLLQARISIPDGSAARATPPRGSDGSKQKK